MLDVALLISNAKQIWQPGAAAHSFVYVRTRVEEYFVVVFNSQEGARARQEALQLALDDLIEWLISGDRCMCIFEGLHRLRL